MKEVTPEDPTGPLIVRAGLGGGTALSMQRRFRDSRFATRYFVGNGLDVGGGKDPLSLYGEFFPLMRNVVKYDKEQGDAQLMLNVRDGSFDFLYSSHCLEHMVDPAEALRNWVRVVRSGGHLIISVPDEDMYEQGVWPSTYNTGHRHTFTMCKQTSWSPVSINLLPLLADFAGLARTISVETIDHGFRRQITNRVDQTRTPLSESAIEFVLVKY